VSRRGGMLIIPEWFGRTVEGEDEKAELSLKI
jgi:hypothetical protein